MAVRVKGTRPAAGLLPFTLEVKDNQLGSNKVTYYAFAPPRGVLLGAMTRLVKSNSKFTLYSAQQIALAVVS
ncbi:hypothetical protein CRUP_005783 [Coryphaenoides rupestris]|nr:hypothetical protein CRUP_005783 [Coryphaenoides rupestris]